ncbi:MAG: hypothetical protein E7611_07870 [Ruminococcaceae bacterium]|nr:hypothetical protein [Oscillospiraceae bacterium]
MSRKRIISIISIILLLSLMLSAISCDSRSDKNDKDKHSERGTVRFDEESEPDSFNSGDVTEPNKEDESLVETESEKKTDIDETEASSTESGSQSETVTDEKATEKPIATEKPVDTKGETEPTETEPVETGCPHEYEYDCTDECLLCGEIREDPSSHAYSQFETCNDLVCARCGFILEQDHEWVYHSGTATLISAGTVIEQCTRCLEKETYDVEQVDPAILGMPVIYITDLEDAIIPLASLKKNDGEILVKYQYVSNNDEIDSFECISEIKVQGASSAGHPKKNYNVKFFTDGTLAKKLKVDLGWGKENKYCMKANYIDVSQSRNIIGGKLFAQLVESRKSIAQGLLGAPNYGVVDGFPIIVYVNGEFHGLYTMNIPKDDWMFGMEGGEESREALLMADAWTGEVSLKKQIGDGLLEEYGFELEHCSTVDDSWVRISFNRMVEILNCGDKDRIIAELPLHLDIEAAIDNMIYTYFINTADNTAKNILWATYDGTVWIPSMYDMDGSFGIYWDGTPLPVDSNDHNSTPRNTFPSINANATFYVPGNQMYQVLIKYFSAQVRARYLELRKTVFSYNNFSSVFEDFFDQIPEVVYASDLEKWTRIPYADDNRDNMFIATKYQLQRLDAFFYEIY